MEQSLWWATSGIGDGIAEGYAQDAVTEHWRMLFCQDPTTQGVAMNYLNGLAVTNPQWADLQVGSGGGVCYGFGYRNTNAMTFTPFTPTLGTTGWRLVLRTDWVLQTVRIVLLQNSDGASGIPALTQNAGYRWEISLAHGTVTIGNAIQGFTDDRVSLSSSAIITPTEIQDRTRRDFVAPGFGWNMTDGTGHHLTSPSGLPMADSKIYEAYGFFAVRNDFVGSLVLTPIFNPGATGNINVQVQAWYSTCGENVALHTDTVGYAALPVTQSLRNCISALTLPSARLSAFVDVVVRRDAVDAADTINTFVWYKGFYVDYVADS